MTNMGLRIKQHRKESGLSQQELSERIGVARSLVCHWETGRRTPTISDIQKLSDILNCPQSELIGERQPLDPLIIDFGKYLEDNVKTRQRLEKYLNAFKAIVEAQEQ